MLLNRKLHVVCLTACMALVANFASPTRSVAQTSSDEAAARAAAEAKLEAMMDDLGLFYKTTTTDTGAKRYVVLFTLGDDSTEINLSLRNVGTHRDHLVFSVYAWSGVYGDGDVLPPAVIKLIATENDGLSVGSFSMSKDFKLVFVNCALPIDQASSPSLLYMCLGHLHVNRINLRDKITPIQSSN